MKIENKLFFAIHVIDNIFSVNEFSDYWSILNKKTKYDDELII